MYFKLTLNVKFAILLLIFIRTEYLGS
uniref:Uncharacterized protein n=1 Tax=Amphimedon queenslandica TaxID=400682 RepID=A0A1X7U9H8_AMPQE